MGLEPGSPLPSEPEIIEQSGLGRASVREALRVLEAQGLVVIRRGSNGGIFVAHPDPSTLGRTLAPMLTLANAPLSELTVYRKAVEPAAAALAAEHGDAEGKKRLLDLAEHDPGPGFGNEVAFHELITELADNLLLRVLVKAPHDLLREHLKSERIDQTDVEEANSAHRAIARAIASGDGAKASRAMLRHLVAFEERMNRDGRLDRPIVPREHWLRDSSADFSLS
jgi:GntR family transcriptional repressor for pyruvate dehydrogenase complex